MLVRALRQRILQLRTGIGSVKTICSPPSAFLACSPMRGVSAVPSAGKQMDVEELIDLMWSRKGDDEVFNLLRQEQDSVVNFRRQLHQMPELGLQWGLEVHQNIASSTGVVAVVRGQAETPCVAFRVDMDALPIEEKTGRDFASHNGCMHACGHDAHMAMALVTAKVLSHPRVRSRLKGTVKFVFQPGEEGFLGARDMVEAGVLENTFGPTVDEIYGLHVWNYADAGQFDVAHGSIMAACDMFDIVVREKGGHGAVPQGTSDAIVAAANLVTTLQTIGARLRSAIAQRVSVARNVDPLDSAVLTVGTVRGGTAANVIADEVTLTGTLRTLQEKTREKMLCRTESCCSGLDAAFGTQSEFNVSVSLPPTQNQYEVQVKKLKEAASSIFPPENITSDLKTMGSEDFGFFLRERPGVFAFVGSSPVALQGDMTNCLPHHKSIFDIDERTMVLGSSTLLQLVINSML